MEEHDKKNIDLEEKKLELEIEKTKAFYTMIESLAPKVSSYFEQKLIKHETPMMKASIFTLAGTIILILISAGFLVYVGKLDSSSFTFIVGTVLGYLMGFTRIFWKGDNKD